MRRMTAAFARTAFRIWLSLLLLAAPSARAQFPQSADINSALPAGSITKNGAGSFTVVGGGADIWDVADQFFYAWSEANGDFDLKVRVESLTPQNKWSKAGLMVRESTAADARMVFNRVTPNAAASNDGSGAGANDSRLAYRTGLINNGGANGGQHEDGTGAPAYPNAWLRLQRTGNTFIGYQGPNGVNWTNQGTLDTATWQGGALPSRLLIGLAVTSHSQGNGATAEFRDLAPVATNIPAIIRQPASTNVAPGTIVTFSVGLSGFDPNWSLQWRTNGVAVPGATNFSYTPPAVLGSDSGKQFSVTVSNAAGGVVSANATLTVSGGPVVTSISSRGNPNGVTLVWSVPVATNATNKANYVINNGLTVTAARYGASNAAVILTTSTQAEGVNYTVTISNVTDTSMPPNSINPNPLTTSFVHGAGYEARPITFKKFNNIAGNAIGDLTNNAAFPNNPTTTNYPALFEDPSPSDDQTTNNNYGAQLTGLYTAPSSGTYVFYMSSDDQGRVFLSTDDQPANKFLLCYEPEWNGARDYTGTARRNPASPENRSTNIALVAGQRYYLEALMKEGSGGNNVSVAAQEPGQGVPTTPIASARFAPVRYFGSQTFFTLGAVSFTKQPVNTTINENATATLSCSVDGTPPYTLQWFSNGVAVAGATNFTHVTPALNAAASGANYSVSVSNEFSSATSTNGRVTVTPDTTRPIIALAQNIGVTSVDVIFSEPVELATATNKNNYALSSGVTVSAAALGGDLRTVTLTVSPLTIGSNYTVTVNNVRDRASTPNTILANSTFVFTANDFTPVDIGGPVPPGSGQAVPGGNDVTGGGADIGGTADSFHFEYQKRTGDFDVKVRVASLGVSDAWASAALMARETLAAGSTFAASIATPSLAGCFFEYRASGGGGSVTVGSFPANYPQTWLRLQRAGNQFQSFASYDGTTWTFLGSATITMSNMVFLGFAVTSHNTNITSTAQFRDFMNVSGGTIGASSSGLEPPGPSSRKTPFVFSEILYKPAPRADGRNIELVELFNSNPFAEDVSGYRITGDIDYEFPANTVMRSGSFLVIAKVPADVQAVYGLSGVLGPYTSSLGGSSTLRLRNKEGSVLLELTYDNELPWPVAPDGTGHSLVLARPSYGEADPRAWAASDVIGGSPGQLDAFRPAPQRHVVINELLAHTDDPVLDFIELYNHSTQAIDLSGCWLSDDPTTNKFRLANGTTLGPRSFISFNESQLGFSLSAAGEQIFFVNSNQTRVLDAVSFPAQQNGVSLGRWPDGASEFYSLTTRTAGTNNSAVRVGPIVINEIMYAPISNSDDDEFIEIYNRGGAATNLTGWKLTGGIDFEFPSNKVLAANSYLVVARNITNLLAKYPALNSNNCVGNFDATLANRGERIVLTMPDDLVSTNNSGQLRTNQIDIVADEVTYGVGGRWGNWAKEGGSSLELTDARANHRLAYNWTDSDESAKAAWVTIGVTNGTLDLGSTQGGQAIDRLEVILLGEGECLLDNVEVLNSVGASLLSNTNFESGLSPWTPQGDHIQTALQTSGGFGGGQCLRIKATARGDSGANRIRVALTSALSAGSTATIRARVRWLRGWPEIVLRLEGNYLEATGSLAPPTNLGTPGAVNSRATNNAGPAIYEVAHAPVTPVAAQAVVVTARVHDPDGVASFTLFYRVDPSASYASVTMRDDGTLGDAIAGDGLFSATIPGQSSGALVAFYLQATDGFVPAVTTQFPRGASATGPECLVRFGDPAVTSGFGTYRLWLTQNNVNTWINRPSLSNERVEGTFVYGDFRAIYNTGSKYSGSPYHQGFSSPLNNCHISTELPHDDQLLGTENFNKIHQPGNGAGDDNTILREQTGYWMVRQIGLPWNYRRFVAMFVNGTRKGNFMEDTQTPGSDVIDSVFPDDPNGDLYKLQPWFEFDDVTVTGSGGAGFDNESWCTLNKYTSGGVHKLARYRHNFLKRAAQRTANNYTNVFNLVDAANLATNNWTNFMAAMDSLVDVDQWLRTFAIEHAVGNWDSFGNNNAQNMYGYKPECGRWRLLIWDFNILLNNSGTGTGSDGPSGDDLFKYNGADSNMGKLYACPPYRRAYWRALHDIANGPMLNANADPVMNAKYQAIIAAGQNVTPPDSIKGYISARRAYLLSQLGTVAASFATGADFTTNNNYITLSGTAPVSVKTIRVNGVAYPLEWTSVTGWILRLPIAAGANLLTLQGYDSFGQPIAGASDTINVNNTAPSASPTGNVVINEIMYNPATDGGSFVEVFNAHSSYTFDLSNWRLDGADFTFSEGTVLLPGRFLVVAADAKVFTNTYGATRPLVGEFSGQLDNGGETLQLIKPGATPALDQVIDAVKYDDDLPWPVAADGTGASLQLIDPTQDNARAGNWTAVATNLVGPYATPGLTNNVRTNLAAFPLVWINELQVFNTNGAADNFGEREPWIELYNNGPTNVNLAGMFLTANLSNLTAWPFPAGTSIAPGQFLVVWADGESGETSGTNYHTSFRLTNAAGTVALTRTNAGRTNVLDYVTYFGLSPDRSFGDLPDGQPFTRRLFFFATPGATNNPALAPVAAVINEWMADNAAPDGFPDPVDGLFQDWVELFNPNTNAVDLSGYYLTDNLSQSKKWQVPPGTMISPLGYLLVWADNTPGQNGLGTNGDLHASFQLNNGGEALGLFAPDGSVQHAVTFGEQQQNISAGFWPDGNTNGAVYFMTNFTPRRANVLSASNAAPTLNPIGNKSGNELSPLNFVATASDPDAGQSLTFSLEAGAPPGASIIAGGSFTWIPTEAQGPGNYPVTVRVTDNGFPSRSATETITITVNEVNAVPVLATIGNKSINEGALLTFTNSATDSDLPVQTLSYSLDAGAPANASINAGNGVFTWMPTEAQGPGPYSITVRVTDNGTPPLNDSETVTVTVNEVNTAPTLVQPANVTTNEGSLITFAAIATDPDLPANTLTFTLVSGPTGAAISPGGVFTWTPGESQGPNTNNILMRVSDGALTDSKTFAVIVQEVNSAPVLNAIGSRTASEGTALTFTAGASDADLPSQFLTFSLSNAPAGATIHGTNGFFSWTPGESFGGTTNSFTVVVTDNGSPGLSASETISFVVSEVNSPPVIAPVVNRSTNESALFSFTVAATDADSPAQALNWSLEPGAPTGAAIAAANGAFTWTPDESQGPGSYPITVRVTDNGAPPTNDLVSFTLTVTEVNLAPTLTQPTNATINESSLFTFMAGATDSDLPAQPLTFSVVSGPPGVVIHPTSGVFTWTPDESQGPGTNNVTLRVSDGSLADTRSFVVVVREVNSTPTLAPIGNQSVREGTLLTLAASAMDADVPANALTFSLDPGAPANAAVNPTNGVFSWTPTEAQGGSDYSVTLRVTDDGTPSFSAAATFTITVTESNSPPSLGSIGERSVNEGATLSFTATAGDLDSPAQVLTFTLDAGAPPGASINATNGVFTWMPAEADGPGTNFITVRVTDNGSPPASDAETIRIVVHEVNSPPALAVVALTNVNEQTTLTFTATATDPDLPAQSLTFGLTPDAPMGASITPAGVFMWTPTEGQGPGSNLVRVIVIDAGSPPLSATQAVSIVVNEVNRAPTLMVPAATNVNELATLTLIAAASDPDEPAQALEFSLDAGSPAGASITTNGVFTWMPGEADGPGSHIVRIIVADAGSPTLRATQAVTIAVAEVNQAPVLGAINDRIISEHELLSFTIGAQELDNNQTLAFSLDAGAPAGAAIDPVSGLFTWTPGETHGGAAFPITVRATDDGTPALHDTKTFQITVLEVNSSPSVQAIASTNANEGEVLTFTVSATDSDQPVQNLTFSLGSNAPPGIAISTTNGMVSWVPDETQGGSTNSIFVLVTDDGLPSATCTAVVSVVVRELNSAPLLAPIANRSVAEDALLSFFISATDEDLPAQTLTYSLDPGAPAGLHLDAQTGEVSWNPGEDDGPGTYLVTFRVTDGGSPAQTAFQTVAITVSEVNATPSLSGIPDQMRAEGSAVTFVVTATDPDRPAQQLTFSLDAGAPGGASINPTNGAFAWTPSEADGPGTYFIGIRVTDDGVPARNAGQTVRIDVTEVNTAPVLAPIGLRLVNSGRTLSFTVTATDADLPEQNLSFFLDAAPAGATLDPATGVFSWLAPVVTASTTNQITVRVQDSSAPILSDMESFEAVVVAPPRFITITEEQGQVTLVWSSFPGKTYRLLWADDVTSTMWTPLGADVVAGGSASTRQDSVLAGQSRFYRVLQLD